ncbi:MULTISPECIES: hypothetical protein [Candidatus Ichthyocystis]|uniref:Putative membrane protein n=1 Tax=Candidatus Ichthyocystis hellenicum TaxID=1561003 RepID=A0A0S4M300_9BURK|nr:MULTISPECIES: hypothetical protein [Ichthyocystis]CUT17391.1 putative membrane protein [Candidatus Ichthyocystis hellenicum]
MISENNCVAVNYDMLGSIDYIQSEIDDRSEDESIILYHGELEETQMQEWKEESNENIIPSAFTTRTINIDRSELHNEHRTIADLEYNTARRNKNAIKFLRYRSIILLCTMLYISLAIIAVYPYCQTEEHKGMVFISIFFGLVLSSIFQIYFYCLERFDISDFNILVNHA